MIVVALGGNIPSTAGEPDVTIHAALSVLYDYGVTVIAVSRFYRTPAWPDASEPPFVNAAAIVDTDLPPDALLNVLHTIEARFGRVRSRPNAPRTLDLDLVDYHGKIMHGALTLPHPRVAERAFVLVPLSDVAPDWCHPVSGIGVRDIVAHLPPSDLNDVVPL